MKNKSNAFQVDAPVTKKKVKAHKKPTPIKSLRGLIENVNEESKLPSKEKNVKNYKSLYDTIANKFNDLMFDAETHSYTTTSGLELTSVTQSLKLISKPFNTHLIATVKAKSVRERYKTNQDVRTKQYYTDRWGDLAIEASKMGTRVHNYAETYPYMDLPFCNKERGVLAFYDSLPNHYIIVALEYRMYDESTKISGTIDMLIYNMETGKYIIADWKTNRRNIFEVSGSSKLKGTFKNKETLQYEKLTATNFNKYQLQLGLYRTILNKVFKEDTNALGMEDLIEDTWIIWLDDRTNVNMIDSDRKSTYKIDGIEPFVSSELFKVYKTDYLITSKT